MKISHPIRTRYLIFKKLDHEKIVEAGPQQCEDLYAIEKDYWHKLPFYDLYRHLFLAKQNSPKSGYSTKFKHHL